MFHVLTTVNPLCPAMSKQKTQLWFPSAGGGEMGSGCLTGTVSIL